MVKYELLFFLLSQCWKKDGFIVTDKEGILSRWAEHFNDHLNQVEEEQPPSHWPRSGNAQWKRGQWCH